MVAAMRGALLAALMLCACSHGSPERAGPETHDAAGCLRACPGASVVETSPSGDKCRCWSHDVGMQYTFEYPDNDDKLSYAKSRWLHAVGIVRGCKLQGLGWEPSDDGNTLQCARYDGSPPRDLLKRIAFGSP